MANKQIPRSFSPSHLSSGRAIVTIVTGGAVSVQVPRSSKIITSKGEPAINDREDPYLQGRKEQR
jgi:hypothetical protein